MIAERRDWMSSEVIAEDAENTLDTKQAMAYLDVGESTIYNARAMGRLVATKFENRLRFTREALDAYRQEHMQEGGEVQRPTLVPPPEPEPEELLTATEAADYMKRSSALVYLAHKNGKLVGVPQPNGKILYRPKDLDAYLEAVTTKVDLPSEETSPPLLAVEPDVRTFSASESEQGEQEGEQHESLVTPWEPLSPSPLGSSSDTSVAAINSVIGQMIQKHVESSLHAYTEELVRERAKGKQLALGMKEVRAHIDLLIREYETNS